MKNLDRILLCGIILLLSSVAANASLYRDGCSTDKSDYWLVESFSKNGNLNSNVPDIQNWGTLGNWVDSETRWVNANNYSSTTNNDANAAIQLNKSAGNTTVEFDMKGVNTAGTSSYVGLQNARGGPAGCSMGLQLGLIKYISGGSWVDFGGIAENNVWYHFKVTYDDVADLCYATVSETDTGIVKGNKSAYTPSTAVLTTVNFNAWQSNTDGTSMANVTAYNGNSCPLPAPDPEGYSLYTYFTKHDAGTLVTGSNLFYPSNTLWSIKDGTSSSYQTIDSTRTLYHTKSDGSNTFNSNVVTSPQMTIEIWSNANDTSNDGIEYHFCDTSTAGDTWYSCGLDLRLRGADVSYGVYQAGTDWGFDYVPNVAGRWIIQIDAITDTANISFNEFTDKLKFNGTLNQGLRAGVTYIGGMYISGPRSLIIYNMSWWNGTYEDRPGQAPSPIPPVISEQVNYSNDNLTWYFQAQSDSIGFCTLWHNQTGTSSWSQNETTAVTAATAFNFTSITFDQNLNLFWGLNCSSIGGETWGTNESFVTQQVDVIPPVISNQINWTNDRLTYTMGAQSDSVGQCTLWGNWTGSWAQNESQATTAATDFNFTAITLAGSLVYSWGINCSDSTGNEAWGDNISFTSKDINAPLLININCTSEAIMETQPFAVNDTTPTFKVLFDEAATCKISNVNQSYDDMTYACGTTGDLENICTLNAGEALTPTWGAITHVYLACTDGEGNNNTLPLPVDNRIEMNITSHDTGPIGGLTTVSFRAHNSTHKNLEPTGQDGDNPAFSVTNNGTACANVVYMRNNDTTGTALVMECADNYDFTNSINITSIQQSVNVSSICGGDSVAIFCRLQLDGQSSRVYRRALFELKAE